MGSTILGYAGFALFAALVILGVMGKPMGGGPKGGKGGE